jgi:aminoglycoside phosphotransferase (APT) family kinase protein
MVDTSQRFYLQWYSDDGPKRGGDRVTNRTGMPYVDLSTDPAAVRRIFVSLGLIQEHEELRALPLAGGISSGIYRVDLRSGSYCVKQALPRLKVAKDWRVPVERVFSEIDYLRTVSAIAPGRVPHVIGRDDTTKSFVMELFGPEFRNWKPQLLAGHVDPEVAAQVGDLLGRIHSATADRADIAARFATDDNFYAIRLEPYLVESSRVHTELSDLLLRLVMRTAQTRRVLVHGDVSPKNILVGPDGPVLIDAECAWFGDPAFDVAFCLNHFFLKAAHMPQHVEFLMRCVSMMTRAYHEHVDWEPNSQLEARVASLLPGLALARIDGKSPVEYLDAPARDAVRALAITLLRQPPTTVEEIRTVWGQELKP